VNIDQIITTAIAQAPGGLALLVVFYFVRQALSGHVHFDSEVDGLKQDKRDMIDINKSQAAALEAANRIISSQNEILRDGIRKGRV
jgi:hypothetical protein